MNGTKRHFQRHASLWSALTSQRFGLRRPVAAVGKITKLEKVEHPVAKDGGDRSPKTKAVTGYRTPKWAYDDEEEPSS